MSGRIVAVAAVLMAFNVSCSDGHDLCPRLAGLDFRSEDAISSILGPDGVEPSDEFVEFSEDEAVWYYSDIGEIGAWECGDNRVSLLDGRFEADVVEEDGRLVLDRDGIRYLEEE
jgi:hypothetical protein